MERKNFFLVVFDKPNVFQLFYSNLFLTFNNYKKMDFEYTVFVQFEET